MKLIMPNLLLSKKNTTQQEGIKRDRQTDKESK